MTAAEACKIIDALYETWYVAAARYASRLTPQLDIAEDAVQEAFFSLYRALCAGRTVENPKAWTLQAIRVQIRVRMGVQRAEARMLASDVALDDMPSSSSTYEADHDLRVRCAVLTAREQEVVFLRLAEMKYSEIAEELHITPSSVNTLLARALRKLQRAFSAENVLTAVSFEVKERDARRTLQ